jgi:uncharacterized membrane protein
MSERFQVVFTGKLKPGSEIDQVVDHFSEKFRVERDKADRLIRGARPVVLKKGLELDKALKYLAVLQHFGMVVELDPKPATKAAPQPQTLQLAEVEPENVEPAIVEPAVNELTVNEPAVNEPAVNEAAPEQGAPQAPAASEPSLSDLALEPLDNGGDDTTEVLDPHSVIDHCPKCGSHRMEMGICQDCGIVASKYLAAQARQAEDAESEARGEARQAEATNPYTAPEADLEQPMEGEMDGPFSVSAVNGFAWLGRGWGFFKDSPLGWILALIVWVVLSTVIGLVPFLGGLIMVLLGPVITAGFMVGCSEQEQGEDFTVSQLFSGFSHNAGQLVLVGVFYLVMIILISVLMVVMTTVTVGSAGNMNPQEMEAMAVGMWPLFLLYGVLFLVLMAMVMMTYIFAPALVALEEINAYEAMKLSFRGCLKNLLPLTVYGIAGLLLSLVIGIPMILMALSIVPVWLGVILAIGVGMVLFPTFTASIYSAYRDIYYSH